MKKTYDSINKTRLSFREKSIIIISFAIMLLLVAVQAYTAYHADITQQKERARLNAKVYAEELQGDFEKGEYITDALETMIISANGKVNRFDEAASRDMRDYISSIQLAPDSVVKYIYPIVGNEAGLIDLSKDKERGEIVSYGKRTRKTTMQGPFDLRQGGRGIAIRNPVYLIGKDGEEKFWGFTIVIIKTPAIYQKTLDALESFGYDYCLDTTKSPLSSESQRVVSSLESGKTLSNPVRAKFKAGGCTWTLSVEKNGGWSSPRLAMVLLTGLLYMIFAMIIIYLLIRTRNQHRELIRKATTDELTGILNRRGFIEKVESDIKDKPDEPMTAIFIDLDDFKQINDLYGHYVGDCALKNLAGNLLRSFPDDSIVGRTGGDEFCVIIKGRTPDKIRELIVQATARDQSFELEKRRYTYTISAGYAYYPSQADNMSKLINYADQALYSAKMTGKNKCVCFEPEMSDVRRTQLGFSFRALAEGIPGAFLIYCASGSEEILFANTDLIRMMGCSSFDDFITHVGDNFRSFVHPDDIDRVESSIWEQIDRNRDRSTHPEDYVEYRVTAKDGTVIPVIDIGRLIHTENYGDVFFVFIRKKDGFATGF